MQEVVLPECNDFFSFLLLVRPILRQIKACNDGLNIILDLKNNTRGLTFKTENLGYFWSADVRLTSALHCRNGTQGYSRLLLTEGSSREVYKCLYIIIAGPRVA